MNQLATDPSYKDAYMQRRERLGMAARPVQRVLVNRGTPEPLMITPPPTPVVAPVLWRMGPAPIAVCAQLNVSDLAEVNMDFSRARVNREWKRIVLEVCQKHGIKWMEMRSKHRNPKVVHARYEAFYRLRMETAMSFAQIGDRMGGWDHTTAIRGFDMWKAILEASA